MKKVLRRSTVLAVAIILSLTMFAQEHPKKQSAREVAEKGSRGDLIIGKKEQKKELNTPPVKIIKPDAVRPLPKKVRLKNS